MSREFGEQFDDVSPEPSSRIESVSPITEPLMPSWVVPTKDTGDVYSVTAYPLERPSKEGTEAKSHSAGRWRSFMVPDESVIEEIKSESSACVVQITVWSEAPRDDGYRKSFVVESATFWSPVNRSDWSTLLPESARDQRATDDSAAKGWQKAISDWSAKKLEEPLWKQDTQYWDLSKGRGIASIADGLNSIQDQWHDLVLKRPAEIASEAVGLSAPASTVLCGVVGEHKLPGDTLIRGLKRVVQVTGVVAGVTTGNLHMAHACLASYTQDWVTEIVSDELVKLFTK